MSESIGLMEGAFFVSRGELLIWLNKTFKLNLTKIEQLGTGSVYCQIFDAIHPGKIPLHKVNWKCKHEWEFVNNFKVLQQCFLKFKMNKYIDIERLIKAKYQDNLEFAQWMKRYYDLNHASSKEYDPEARRGAAEPDFSFADKLSPPRERARDLSRGRSKDILSLSPSMRKVSKLNASSVDPRKRANNRNEDDELKKLQKNLLEMKRTIAKNTKMDSDQKLKLISRFIDTSLEYKLFNKIRQDTDRSSEKTLEKIDEQD